MRPVTLFLCGDMMTGRGIDQILPTPSDPVLFEPYVCDARDYVMFATERSGPVPRSVPFDYVWGDALDELDAIAPDARIVNLETAVTVSDDAWPGKGINYRMHPNNVPCLTAADIDVCVLANNHLLDWGRRGLLESLDVLREEGLEVCGAGRTIEDAERPAVVHLASGGRVLVFGFADVSSGVPRDWAATATTPGIVVLPNVSKDSAETVGRRIRKLKRPGDIVVASVHWGSNWGYGVPDAHIHFAHALIDAGVDVIHGHSSHHPRPIEIYRHRLVLYGCGDFLNDYEGIEGHESYRGDLTIMYFATIDPTSGILHHVRMVPMRTRRFRLERAEADDIQWLAGVLERTSRPYGTHVGLIESRVLEATAATSL